jgi:hypothetical protein
MKFKLEITSGRRFADECLSRAIVDTQSIDIARAKAALLLEIWSARGANGVRILSENGNPLDDLPHSAATTSERAV